jgi:hypothetical protein
VLADIARRNNDLCEGHRIILEKDDLVNPFRSNWCREVADMEQSRQPDLKSAANVFILVDDLGNGIDETDDCGDRKPSVTSARLQVGVLTSLGNIIAKRDERESNSCVHGSARLSHPGAALPIEPKEKRKAREEGKREGPVGVSSLWRGGSQESRDILDRQLTGEDGDTRNGLGPLFRRELLEF